jgi:ParB family chromosome partitioning protein
MGAGMTRKHVFPPLPSPGAAARPADSSAPRPRTGPVGAIGRIMGEMRDESERAAALLGQIESAERVVEIAPALIDPSPIRDRIDDPAATEDAELRASIAEHGQQVPVLLRPGAGGRYVTVFGHRRVAALRALGRPVRAVVSDLSEREALVVQGQENNERKNTSFIERCLYARRLEEAGLSGQDIAAATGVAKSMASMMNVITQHIPEPLIRAIGPAPDVGRPRWTALAKRFAEGGRGDEKLWRGCVGAEGFSALPSGERFQRVVAAMAAPRAQEKFTAVNLADREGAYGAVRHSRRGATITLARDDGAARSDGRSFALWLENRLPALRESWRKGE